MKPKFEEVRKSYCVTMFTIKRSAVEIGHPEVIIADTDPMAAVTKRKESIKSTKPNVARHATHVRCPFKILGEKFHRGERTENGANSPKAGFPYPLSILIAERIKVPKL